MSTTPKRPWSSASLLDGLGLPPNEIDQIRPLLRPSSAGGISPKRQVVVQRRHLRILREQVVRVANETKQPSQRALHQDACKRSTLLFFNFLSGEGCSFDDCAAVAEKDMRFSCPLLPAQADAASDCYTRTWQGIGAFKDVATKAFPTRLEGLVRGKMQGCCPSVKTTFEVMDSDMVFEGLQVMCRFSLMVRIATSERVYPLVQAAGMAKGCFSMASKLLSLDIRFDVYGLLRDLESTVHVALHTPPPVLVMGSPAATSASPPLLREHRGPERTTGKQALPPAPALTPLPPGALPSVRSQLEHA